MSSVLKPASVAQNSPVPPQLNKPMHPQQGPPQSYGQPPNHHPMVSHGNPTAAHNHPATHQQNHYSLNVPNSFMGGNQPIPASNHPIPNNPSQPSGQQMYSGAKNMSYQGGYQTSLGHTQNSSNQLPPVSQSLPATNSQSAPHAAEDNMDKSQSNGTTEEKSNHAQENHVTTPKEISATPALPTQSPLHSKQVAEPQKPNEPETVDTSTESAGQSGQKTSASAQSTASPADQQQNSETAENSSNVPLKETAQNESDASVQSEKKTEDGKDDEVKEDGKVSDNEGKTSDNKKEPSVAELESANTPNDSEKAVLESVEAEAKEKTTPKRSNPRKASRGTKNEEDSKPAKSDPKPSQSQKSPSTSKSKRARIRTQPYQSPLPELEIITKITASQRNKTNDEKLIVFFKNEFLAVRNPEGSFYVCQAVQNIYKSSAKIRIRWLSLDKNDKTNQIYIPDFYDHTDFDCILTNLNLGRIEKGKFRLPPAEKERTDSILKRSLAAEKGEEIPSPTVNEEHPDGYENQLNKRTKKRKATSPLKSTRTSSRSPSKPSADTPKVAKTTPKPTRKAAPKKETPATGKKAASSPALASKTPSGSRTDRAKRRSDTINSTKVTPVSPKVDQKKARALAKVARKSVVQTSKVQTPVKKETKETKPTPSKTAKTTGKVSTSAKKKTPKRSSAKK
ncbi:muscle M-line assembly protein unc-89-like isoform X2 [Harmonia axyridis]|uniref:muscle M-line assembly protein unc-89-like isoform X2 n=1 Tax=Harmonia axyridis TaxID=115357 RepID=UPI001E278DDF|nr:muscle M-line assembly protein unc-89-like isoform X2 [Harmonia axyridis]